MHTAQSKRARVPDSSWAQSGPNDPYAKTYKKYSGNKPGNDGLFDQHEATHGQYDDQDFSN